MNTRKTVLALAVAAALAVPLAASAQGLGFNYLEANYVNVDLDLSESFTDEEGTFSLETDNGDGFHIGGAWEVWENLHLFGEYSQASQDLVLTLTIGGETESVKDDFDVIRYRVGLGYAYPVSDEMSLYGRVSYDYLEFDFDVDSVDDSGVGAEVGLVWAAMPQFHLQPYAAIPLWVRSTRAKTRATRSIPTCFSASARVISSPRTSRCRAATSTAKSGPGAWA
jgi:hypothetical protein